MALLSLTLFGGNQITFAGKPLTAFRSAKVQALLIYLALTSQQTHDRNVPAALLWPDDADAVAKKNLRQSLYQLRQVLADDSQDPPFLLASRTTVQFNAGSNHTIDVTTFRNYLAQNRLDEAVNLYRGELLPGFSCDSPAFDEWLRGERDKLHQQALDAFYALAGQSLAGADYGAARDYAKRRLELESWREESHIQLMQALALSGERSAALAQYETCQAVLAEELGTEPSSETKALFERIRDQGLESAHQADNILPFRRRRLVVPFVGRKVEHSLLADRYQQALQTGCQVVVLVGEAGIGKTRLASNFQGWAAAQGADLLSGQAFKTSERLSYQPLTQLLRKRLERENAPEDLLSDLWLTQLSRILPELRERYPDLPAPIQEENAARQHLFEAIARLGLALSERSPLVIFIDDWHWADSASLDVFHYAVMRWIEEGAPILALLTVGQEHLFESSNLQDWLAYLKHDAAFQQIHLSTLSKSETDQLLHAFSAPENLDSNPLFAKFGRWLFDETNGQPFFLVEILKTLVEEKLIQPDPGEETWHIDWETFNRQAVESRVLPGALEIFQGLLDRLSAPGRALLAAAAVLGQRATFDALCLVAGLKEVQALEALDELLAKQILVEAKEMGQALGSDFIYNFSHQKLSEVVYNQAGAARRRFLHRQAFETLRSSQAQSAELAYHTLQAGLWVDAFQYSLAAGIEAMNLHAVKVAISHFETALRLAEQHHWPERIAGTDRQALYSGLGRAYELNSNWQLAQETYLTMIAYAESIGDGPLQCLGMNRLATVYINGFKNSRQASRLLEKAQRIAELNEDQRGLAETKWNLAVVARMEQDAFLSRQYGEEALEMARNLGHPQLLARCLNSLAYSHAALRQWPAAENYAKEASELYAAAGNQILQADSRRLIGWSQLYLGRLQESLSNLEETLRFSQQIENVWGVTESSWRLALVNLGLGRYGRAIQLAEQGAVKAQTVGFPAMVLLAFSAWGTVLRTVMALDLALKPLREIIDKYGEGIVLHIDWPLSELCATYALAGEWEKAAYYFRKEIEARPDPSLPPMGQAGWYGIEALLRQGEIDLARNEIERLELAAGNNRLFHIPLLRSRAILAEWEGDIEAAIEALETAVTLARETGLPGQEWPILGELARLYRQTERKTEARQAAKAAAEIIHRLAETIEDENLKAGFLTAEAVQAVLT